MMSLRVVSYSTDEKAAVQAPTRPMKAAHDVARALPTTSPAPSRFLMDFPGSHFDVTRARLAESRGSRKVAAWPKVLPT